VVKFYGSINVIEIVLERHHSKPQWRPQ